MAVTQGHGNPDWTRDETILALELFFESDMGRLRSADPRVQLLSDVLRALPYHEDAARNERFRNAAGVAFKVQNLRSVVTGKGLQNVSAMDRAIWAEFGDRREEVVRLAALIRAGIKVPAKDVVVPAEDEFYEGRVLTRLHYTRERNPRIRAKLLQARSSAGLNCEICAISYPSVLANIHDAAFEAHHVVPLAEAGVRVTRLADMALLCACCHRLIHRI
ncbi:HNH endonuclease, partial [Mesorhizobium sp. M2A.F.Ca.ET.046.02.1.1]